MLSHDRHDSDKLITTHDLISNMLGVRRKGVTLAAQKLAAKNRITNDRGTMVLLDRKGIESTVCECYEVVNREYHRVISAVNPKLKKNEDISLIRILMLQSLLVAK